ncbi:MAG: hypothetical protein AAF961_05360 [Planctomycetota bacterium]
MRPLVLLRGLTIVASTLAFTGYADAEIPWGFQFGDGDQTVVGTFVTDGRQSDLDGSGDVELRALRLNDVWIDGLPVDLATPLDPAGPRSGSGDVLTQRLVWNRSAQRVASLPDGGGLSWFSNTPPITESELSLSLAGGEFGALLRDYIDSDPLLGPDLTAMITPVRRALLGSDWDGMLYDVDVSTGLASSPRDTGIAGLAGIRYAPDGTLYGIQDKQFPATGGSLYTIDPTTGAATLVGDFGLADEFVEGDLDFHPHTGELYALQAFNRDAGRNGVFTIDVTDGSATLFGATYVAADGPDISAIAFDQDGVWYGVGVDIDDGVVASVELLTFNTTTGATETVVDLDVGSGSVAGMDFDPFTGRLYYADGFVNGSDALYRIDPATGDATRIGATGLAEGLSGLTFPPATLFGATYPPTFIPEARSLALAILGAAALLLSGARLPTSCGLRRQRRALG